MALHRVSRLVRRTLQLNFLPDVDDLMIDLGCPYLRHLSDSGPFVRRPLHVLRVCDFLLAPFAGAVGKGFLHGPSKLRCEILLPLVRLLNLLTFVINQTSKRHSIARPSLS